MAKILYFLARDLDRLRYPLLWLGRGVDRLDRAVGSAVWACRWRADAIERGDLPDDGIPF